MPFKEKAGAVFTPNEVAAPRSFGLATKSRARLRTGFKRTLRLLAQGLKWLCILIGGVILTGLIVGLIAGVPAARYIFSNRENLPDINSFVNFDVPQTGIINDSKGRPIINLAKEYRLVIKPEDITWPIRTAFLSAEDKDFYIHGGVD